MQALLISVSLLFSALAHADLTENAFAKIRYQEVGILDIQSVASKIKHVPASPKNIEYYEGYVVVTALVEGNLCTAVPSSFGTLQTFEGKVVYTKLVAGRAWTAQMIGCPQYSRPTRVSFPVDIGWLIAGSNGVNQSVANFKVGTSILKAASIFVNARGSQVTVSIKKQK
tara:strand:- start:7598 stop:8107 length:510 start_codon:yes stop_codon:yes gene_type:complete